MMKNLKSELDYDIYEQRGNYIIFSDCSHKLYSFYYKCEIKKQQNQSLKVPTHIKKSYVFLLALALLISIFIKMPIDDKIYTEFYTPYEILNNSRSSSEKDSMSISLQMINEKNYEPALNILKNTNTIVSHFYLGVLYQQTDRYVEAIEEYKIIINNKDNLFVEQSEWYLGLCYLQLNESRKAIQQFEKISNHKGYYQLQAKEILKRIKKILL